MSRVLVVDDKEMMRDSVATTLARRGHGVVTAPGGGIALEKLAARPVDVIVTDLQMPDMSGLDLLARVREIDEDLPVIVITAYGTIENAVQAMKQGAHDYITKPFSGDELVVAVERAIEHRALRRDNQVLRAEAESRNPGGRRHDFIGSAPAIQRLRASLGRIAESQGAVLIGGESGTGKEVVARWIHDNSPRAAQPFLAVNCAAMPASLLESELFGHERGAFTGADRLRKGRFELADGGTLLLDEISEIDPALQAKLLRVLQEQTFERVGSSRSIRVDVRVIATTNRTLPDEVAKGAFRQDLFYRLNVLPLTLPPLRERREDIAELAAFFLAQVSRREGGARRCLATGALDLLVAYDWPGNVRELQNICERAAVLAAGSEIDADLIRPWLSHSAAASGPRVMSTGAPGVTATSTVELKPGAEGVPGIVCDGDRVTLEQIEREAIVATLERFGRHRARSARALGIGIRTLGLKLKKWKEEQLVAEDL